MKFRQLLTLSLGLLIPSMAFSAEYYIRPGEATTGHNGTSWDDAINLQEFYDALETGSVFVAGDVFYLAGGTYYPCKVADGSAPEIALPFTFIGGFDPASTGKVTTLPTYPSATPTIFSGDLNGNGKPDQGDANNLMVVRVKSKKLINTVTIQGIDFTCAYGVADNYKAGALFANRTRLVVKNCNVYNNESRGYCGGMAMHGCMVHAIECTFTNNVAQQTGSAFRVSTNQQWLGYAVLERCLVSGNKVTGKYGGGIAFSSGSHFWLVNSTVVGNQSLYDGGGIVTNGSSYSKVDDAGNPTPDIRRVRIVSSTIAGNECIGDPAENEGSIAGSQIRFAQACNVKILNSIIVGKTDDGTLANSAMALTGDEKEVDNPEYVFMSSGYSVLGSFAVAAENPTYKFDWSKDFMTKDNTYSKVFGSNVLADNGGKSKTLVPVEGFNGTNYLAFGYEIGELVTSWNDSTSDYWENPFINDVDFNVDQRGATRGAEDETYPGAYDGNAKLGGVSQIEVTDNNVKAAYRGNGCYELVGFDGDADITVYNMSGSAVKVITNGNQINLTTLPAGMYLVNVNGQTIKLMK